MAAPHGTSIRRRGATILASLIFTLLFLLSASSHAIAEYPPIAIIGDTHVGLSSSIYGVFIKAIERENITIIVHLGDAVDRAESAAQWSMFEDTTGAGKTLHLVQGNHDVGGRGNGEMQARFSPKPYYSFFEGDTLFVILSTELPGQRGAIMGAQYEWLDKELQRSFRYKFVFLHRPLYPVVPGHGLDAHRAARDKLHELFVRQGVSAVFSGHDHVYDRTTRDGVIYVISSGGGGPLFFPTTNGGFFHYMICERKGNGYSFAVRDVKGETRDQFSILR